MTSGARRAGARLAANNAIKIRAALASSADPHRIVSGYLDTHPQVTDSPAQDRTRARAWVMLHVSLDMTAFKQTLRRTYAEFYALGTNEAYEKLRAMKNVSADLSKGGVTTVATKPGAQIPTFSIDWANWQPGNEAAALLLSAPGGLQKLLGDTEIQARGISDTTHDRLGSALADGISKGWTPQEIADSIGETLSDPSRALTIALTEGQRAKIEANVQSYAENGVEQIRWTVNDPDDIDCLENDGEIVNLGDEFPSGDTQPPVHPNCQCDVIPEMPDLSAYPAIDLTTGEDIEESVTADLTKYSPDQERDERGRFGSGNGDGSARHRDTRDSVGAGRILSYKETEAFEHGSAAPFIISDGKGGYRFSAERAALHEQIIQSRLAGIPKSDNPEYHMLGGGPASGKSTMLESGKVEVPATTEAVHIDVDSIKAELPEYDPKNPGFVHEESSYLGKEVQARAFEASQSVVLDGTGNNSVQSVEGKIDTARAYGYRVIANYATVPTSLAVQRDASRSRSVGETRVRDIHASVSQVFPGVAAKFDSVNLWDNSGKVPQLIATGGSGSLRVVDQAAYQAFLDKAGK